MQTIERTSRSLSKTVGVPILVFPRYALSTGAPAGVAMHVRCGVPLTEALATACDAVRTAGPLVSLALPGSHMPLPHHVIDSLARAGVDPGRLELSMSLTAVGGGGLEMLLALSALRDLGVGLALRGFGRGRLPTLPRLPFSRVILAPACLHGVPGDPVATNIVQTLLGLAQKAGMHTVAIGIETEAQRALLSGLGCDDGEGSLFGPAMVRHSTA